MVNTYRKFISIRLKEDMIYFAILKPASAVSENWRKDDVPEGLLHGISFYWDGEKYASKSLSPIQIQTAMNHPTVFQLEVITSHAYSAA